MYTNIHIKKRRVQRKNKFKKTTETTLLENIHLQCKMSVDGAQFPVPGIGFVEVKKFRM